MKIPFIAAGAAAALVSLWSSGAPPAAVTPPVRAARESRVPAGRTTLYARDIGSGPAVIVLHGGPDFDHRYLLPDFDRLADSFRLIYYDQRGRGKSADRVDPRDVTLASELDDLDTIRRHFRLDAPIVLGHSWGAILAMEYALRHPSGVSRLVLMNPAPASAADVAAFRKYYARKLGPDLDRQLAIASSAAYKAGDPAAVTARYRLHFKPSVTRAVDYERLMTTMSAGFRRQGSNGILKARAVEDRLMRDTWEIDGYDLLPRLRALKTPALVISGDGDFIPPEIAEHIAQAIPQGRLVALRQCGHFSYLECPANVRTALVNFTNPQARTRR